MAAAKRGSADGTVSKMLCLHLPSLLSFAEVKLDSLTCYVVSKYTSALHEHTINPHQTTHDNSPQPTQQVEVSPVAQTAAVLGVGLLYQGTAHRLMTEFLLGACVRACFCCFVFGVGGLYTKGDNVTVRTHIHTTPPSPPSQNPIMQKHQPNKQGRSGSAPPRTGSRTARPTPSPRASPSGL